MQISVNESLTNKIVTTLSHFGCVRYNEYDHLHPEFNYTLCTLDYPSVISPLVSHDYAENSDYTCDSLAPIVTLQVGLFTNIHLFGSIFFKDAFWCLPLEIDFDNLQWQIVIQHVQWMLGGKIALFHGKSTLHTSKIKTTTVNEEFIKRLRTIKCTTTEEINTSNCVRKIVQTMFQWNILTKKSMETLSNWFFKLEQYVQPYINGKIYKEECSHKVLYKPSYKIFHKNTTNKYVAGAQSKMQQICTGYTTKQSLNDITNLMQNNITQFFDMLLIIIFNNAHYSAISYTEILSRTFFPYMLYCGPEQPDNLLNISFVSYSGNPSGHRHGSFSYECAILAYHIFPYMPGGYFFVGDDVLILPHLLLSLPTDKIWFVARHSRYFHHIVDFDHKCVVRKGQCDSKVWIGPVMLKMWFVEYLNNTKTMLQDFHKQAKHSAILKE